MVIFLSRSSTKRLAVIATAFVILICTWFFGYWHGSEIVFRKTVFASTKYDDRNVVESPPNVTQKPKGRYVLSPSEQEELNIRLKKATDKKIILVWISGFGAKVTASVDPEICGNCDVTQDRNLLNDDRTGAIIIHFDGLELPKMPPTRNTNQLYIFWDMESPIWVKRNYAGAVPFGHQLKFNATYTHRRDADFFSPYGNVESMTSTILEGNKMTPKELFQMKTKLGVAIVSNCHGTPGAITRRAMLLELISYGVVEGFGSCLGGRNFANGHRRDNTHHEEVKKYKFYFAFENSHHCKDYITEKFFDNALSGFAVPVVWGAVKEDYEAIAPPGSFIHAEDFSSMKELADYIKYLDQNDEAYLEYLKWMTLKPSQLPEYGRQTGWCQICRALHGINVDDIYNPNYNPDKPERPLFTDGISPRTVEPGLIEWFYESEKPECYLK